MTISRDRDGTTVEIEDSAIDDPEFMPGDDLDGGRTMLVRTMEPGDDGEVVREVVIVKTDIDAPTDIPFVKPDEDSKGRYTLEEGEEFLTFVEAHSGLAMLTDSRVSIPTPDGTVTLKSDVTETADVKENEYSGTFDGAMGTFTCTADTGWMRSHGRRRQDNHDG